MAFGDHKGSLTASVASVTNPTDLTGSVAVAVGDLVFGCFSQQTNLTAAGTVTDDLLNTYAYVNAGTDATAATIRCFYSRVTVAGTLTTINVPATASTNDASAVASVIEGPFAIGPLDANPANATDGTSPHDCPASGTLARANEVVMGACALNANATMTATSPGVITQVVARNNISTAVQRVVVAATTTVTPQFGNGATANAAQTTASFKGAFIVTAAAGSYAITGTNASLEFGREVVAGAASYAITGTNATLSKGIPLVAGAGSYAITGVDAALEFGRTIAAAAGSYAVTGTDASLEYGREVVAAVGSYAITGTDAVLIKSGGNKTLVADAGSYSMSGSASSLEYGRELAADAGSYSITGTAVSLTKSSAVVIEETPPELGGGPIRATGSSGRTFTRERYERLKAELRHAREAQEKVERKAKTLKKKAREEVREAAGVAFDAIEAVPEVSFDPRVLAGVIALAASLQAAATAKAAAVAIGEARKAEEQAHALQELIERLVREQDDEEAAITLLLA
jgi:hypothetical protein